MVADRLATTSKPLPDAHTFNRALAEAADWEAIRALFDQTLPLLLPDIRLDILAIDEGTIPALYYSNRADIASAPASAAQIKIRYHYQKQGYHAIALVPLDALGVRYGWLVLAQRRARLPADAQAFAAKLAASLALRLSFERQIAESRRLHSQIQHLNQEIDNTRALRLHATLTAGAAHDIGNILTSLLGYAQLLQQDLPPSTEHDIEMIIRAAGDGRRLLQRLQRDAHSITFSQQPTPVAQVVREVVKLTRPMCEFRGTINILVHTTIDPATTVTMPAEDLREILINLVLNAMDAITHTGVITVICAANGGQAEISVADTGEGIAQEFHSAIFQPLTTMRSGGSGLGLSTSRALAEQWGGTLTVESAPGDGATFTIRLPLSTPMHQAPVIPEQLTGV